MFIALEVTRARLKPVQTAAIGGHRDSTLSVLQYAADGVGADTGFIRGVMRKIPEAFGVRGDLAQATIHCSRPEAALFVVEQ